MRPRRSGGGFAAIGYSIARAREAGGLLQVGRRLATHNTCKTCAVGMGGQQGGMRNEAGSFPEVCKKSIQAQAADMQPPIDETFLRTHDLATLERWSSRELERAGRIGFPIVWREGDTHLRRIGWDEALHMAAGAFTATIPDRTFFYASGRSSNEAAFLLQCFARVYGTNNVNNCSYYCHQASSVALAEAIGSGTATVTLEDLGQADLAVVVGANPASNHPRLITQLVELRRRGGKVIVVNPYREVGLVRFRVPSDWRSMMFGSEVSDLYLQPHVGSDVALLVLLLRRVIERGAVDQAFIGAHTTGWDAVRTAVMAHDARALREACGIPREQEEQAAELLGKARRGIFAWAMGITQHRNGVDNVQAIVNLALARGWVGRPGCGLLPIRGHSNVQGVGSVGVAPALKTEFARRLGELYGVRLPGTPGMHTLASVEAAAAARIDAALLLGGNLFSATPDRAWTGAALRKIGTTVYVSTKLNESHVHGRGRTHLVLPALARDEERQCTTQESMFNFVRLSDGGAPAASAEMRSEVEIIAALAQAVLPPGPVDFGTLTDHAAIRAAIAKVVPGYEKIGDVDRTREEFRVAGRIHHEPRFATPDGRARCRVTPLPAYAPGPGEFRLMTLRSEGQFNTVVYEDEDLYRGNERRDVVMMNAEDARRLGLAKDARVRVENATGAMEALVRLAPLPPGNLAMYYPEANVLIPREIDPRSATPVFKSTTARVEPV
ncbi:MAG TPA: FdhF/YdeP family oxidoreductase [Candidatus Eisenbacteria bacterium]|nr:FdhF/YdeP family oxidoreductase [Candidatus Eisenbacteria bacterium]